MLPTGGALSAGFVVSVPRRQVAHVQVTRVVGRGRLGGALGREVSGERRLLGVPGVDAWRHAEAQVSAGVVAVLLPPR